MKPTSLIVAAVLVAAACSKEPDKAREAAVVVEGERVTLAEPDKAGFLKVVAVRKDSGGILRLPGRLVWNEDRTVRVFPQLGGRVTRIDVEIGATVKAGQALAILASPDFGLALAEERKARADVAVARKALLRNRELLEAGVIARKDWELSEADAARAEAEVDRTARRLATLGGDGGGAYTLRSPLAGTVVERNVNPGQEVRPDQPGAPLFVVTDPSGLWVQLDASESDLGKIKPGEPFSIEVRQYPGARFVGRLGHVADFVDPNSRTIKVRGEVANRDRRLKGEMFVTALIEVPAADVLRVPTQAVFLVGDKRYVFVEEGAGRYLRREIAAGPELGGWQEILSGLKEGERVITEGNLHLLRFFRPPPVAKETLMDPLATK